MSEWEMAPDDFDAALDAGFRVWKAANKGDDYLSYQYDAIATAAQKKLVEWWLDNFNVSALTPELAEKWKAFLAALGVK